MNDQQKAKYLASPDHCPFCGEKHIFMGSWWNLSREGNPKRRGCCYNNECDKSWVQVYTLTDLEEVKG